MGRRKSLDTTRAASIWLSTLSSRRKRRFQSGSGDCRATASYQVADGIWQKLVCSIGDITADRLLSVDEASLRQCGLSPSKIAYLKDLAMRSVSGLDLFALPEGDDDAVDLLMSVHGIGRWTAENYLIFAEGRLDIWPAADLGIRIATGYLYQLSHRPDMKETRGLGDIFRPYRSIMALFLWHQYRNKNFC